MATRPRAAEASALDAIGNTPIVRLQKVVPPDAAEVWVKLEGCNPTGSYKDRMALALIEGAEGRGELTPGMTGIEYTGGSTGSSLAFVCSVKGYRFVAVSSDAFAPEKLRTMRAFGSRRFCRDLERAERGGCAAACGGAWPRAPRGHCGVRYPSQISDRRAV
jgi:cysteine synthase